MPKIIYDIPPWLMKWIDNGKNIDDLSGVRRERLFMIKTANDILNDYARQGYQLTLRQLYYQFVARDLIPNTERSYKNLGTLISDARMWGLLDWSQLVDRTRNFQAFTHWDGPEQVIHTYANHYTVDRWENCPVRFEVWVEKQALEDVIARACDKYDVGYIACKGYMSQSEMWAASQRIIGYNKNEQEVTILHLGDHDPSGIDMSRDIQERLNVFGADVEVKRITLNMDQINEYRPPPNPAKLTDSRANDYVINYGYDSWELDALEPAVITQLIHDEIEPFLDDEYQNQVEQEEIGQEKLQKVAYNWDDVQEFLTGLD